MSDQWMDRLSEYLDDELAADERDALERHLAGCPDCAAVLDELHAVARRAATLEDTQPAADLWSGIEARIAAGRSVTSAAVPNAAASSSPVTNSPEGVVPIRALRRRATFTFTVPQLVAAGLALLLAGGGSVYVIAARAGAGTGQVAAAAQGPAGPAAPADEASQSGPVSAKPGARLAASGPATEQYQATVADLERVLDRGRGRLQPETIQVLERNLAVIDAAIADARRALARDPANAYLNEHLEESMQRKVELLRVASSIINARS